MSSERTFDLDGIRADGWFDRVIANVPALERLCTSIGEPLVALSLVAGFRITSATVDKVSGDVTTLQWVRDGTDGTEVGNAGAPDALRTEVMAALLGEAEVAPAPPASGDPAALRACIGSRYLLLAPLFGLTLKRLTAVEDEEPRLMVAHDGIEELVTARQLRRFLRTRVIDVLQSGRNRSVSIDLEQAEQARAALAAGRFEDVVGRLSGWVAPLMMYLRTPEAGALDPRTRADLGRALGLLGEALERLGRTEEAEETLRLAVQYAQDGPAAAEMYRVLARLLVAHGRSVEAIGPLRRALRLDPTTRDLLLDLAHGFLDAGRAVAALGCLREMRSGGQVRSARLEALEARVRERLGDAAVAFEAAVARRPARP